MNDALASLLADGSGVCHRRDLVGRIPEHVLTYAVAAGHVIRVLPQVYCLPEMVAIGRIRRAALFYAGDGSALSHRTALAVWGLRPAAPDEPIDVTVAGNRRLRNGPGVVIHRRVGSEGLANGTVWRHGLPVVRLERAVVESWPQLDPDERRAPAIVAVRGRRTTAGRLLAAAKQLPKLAGKAELVRLISLLGGGCHSELELWGYDHVFSHPDLPPSEPQVRMELGGRVVYLDRYFVKECVNVELDGAQWHQSAGDRERDLRRDAQLMARGILVVRFTPAQLCDPARVRAELRAILAQRRHDQGAA